MRGLIGLLFLVGLVAVYWKLIVIATIVIFIGKAAPMAYRQLQAEREAERERMRALIARADVQHRQVMAGDDRGIYGGYLPEDIRGLST